MRRGPAYSTFYSDIELERDRKEIMKFSLTARRVAALSPFGLTLPLLAAFLCLPACVQGGDVQWTVRGTFSDGGTLSGSFTYDPQTGVMRSWSLTTIGGDTTSFPPLTYSPATSTFSAVPSAGTLIFQGPKITEAENGYRQLRIGPFSSPLTSAGGTVNLTSSAFGNLECINCAPARTLSGAVVGQPLADLTVTVSHSGTLTPGQSGATYTVQVSNTGAGATTGLVDVSVFLPTGVTLVSASGTGWECSAPVIPYYETTSAAASPSVICTRGGELAPGSSYPPITLTVNIASTAGPTLTSTATISGGGEANTTNNTATDTTSLSTTVSVGETGNSENPAGGTTKVLNSTTSQSVDTSSGNTHITYTDVVVPGKGLHFQFIRSYNDLDTYSGPLCRGWTHTYNILLTENSGTAVTIKEADGHVNVFQPGSTAGSYTAPAGVFDVLVKTGVNTFRLTRPDQTVLAFGPIPLNPLLIRLLTITDVNTNAQALAYDANGNLIRFIDVGGGTFTFAYDALNHLTSLHDVALDRTHQYSCADQNGVQQPTLVSHTDPAGSIVRYTYGPTNLLTGARDARGNSAISNTFDSQGRVVETRRVIGATTCATSYVYDDVNRTARITDPRGAITWHYHDAQKRLTKIVNALGYQTLFTYTSANNVASITNPLGRVTTYTYDSRGNRTSITDPLGNQTTFTYNPANSVTSVTDANGRTTILQYDATGRNLTRVIDALGGITQFAYDGKGNKASFTNAKSAISSYAYNALNRLISYADPLGKLATYSYDSGGRLNSVAEPAGNTKSLTYNNLSRLISIAYTKGALDTLAATVNYSYDANGNRVSMGDATGVTSYAYDALNRITSIGVPRNGAVSYTYDCNNNRLSLTYVGKTIEYTYDLLNRMTSVKDGNLIHTYAYDAADNLLAVAYANGAAVVYSYDAANRLVQVRNVYRGSVSDDPNPASSFTYVVDKVGNRLQVADGSGKTTRFTYDALYRMTSVDVDGKITRYTYDAVGNRLTLAAPSQNILYTYDAADRLLKAGLITFSYNDNGSLISKAAGSTLGQYRYDSENRLVGVTDSGTTSTFFYDGDGNRVRQVVGTGTYDYLNDISSDFEVVLYETGPDGNISYVRGRNLISAAGTGFIQYYQYDGQSTVAGLTDDRGRLLTRYVYDVWGEQDLTIPQKAVGTRNKFGYTGEALDPGTSLYYLRARYYDPDLGRFISKDPFPGYPQLPQSLNRYVYTRNNPATLTDRTGLDPDDDLDWGFPEFFWPGAPPIP
jgi:RHS repeat-associated protein